MKLLLPDAGGNWVDYAVREGKPDLTLSPGVSPVREVYAAAHIVAREGYEHKPGRAVTRDDVDWERTLAFRHHLWDHGFGIAESMDTAQRGVEIGWGIASELLDRTLAEARKDPGRRRVIGGAGADHPEYVRDPKSASLDGVVGSYAAEINFIQERGGAAIIFPNTIIHDRFNDDPQAYQRFIRGIMDATSGPVYLHWLGEAFNSKMAKYWGYESIHEAAQKVVIPLMGEYGPLRRGSGQSRILGIKLSTLDQGFEEGFREAVRENGQIVLTGDDFNFAALIKGAGRYGDEGRVWSPRSGVEYPLGDYSHALLGIFDGIAPVAAKALQHLAQGEMEEYEQLMGATVPLSRQIFFRHNTRLTPYYKVGLGFLAYLNGHQDHYRMLGGIEKTVLTEEPAYFARVFELADKAGLLPDTEKSYNRLLEALDGMGLCDASDIRSRVGLTPKFEPVEPPPMQAHPPIPQDSVRRRLRRKA